MVKYIRFRKSKSFHKIKSIKIKWSEGKVDGQVKLAGV